MTTANRQRLRSIMVLAWVSRREEPTRSFADCLRGAWAWQRRMAKAAKAWAAKAKRQSRGGFMLHGSVVRSAAWDRSSGQRYRGAGFGASNASISRVGG